MRIEKRIEKHGMIIDSVVYDDVYGASELFEPKIWLDFWSKDRKFYLKTALGDIVAIFEQDLRRLNLKMVLENIGTPVRPNYKRFMSVNSPRKASERIPMLSISKKLNKIWRGCINVEREYESRWKNGYRGWCPE